MCMQCGRSVFTGWTQAGIACLHLTPTDQSFMNLDASEVPSQCSPPPWTAVTAGNGSHDLDSKVLRYSSRAC